MTFHETIRRVVFTMPCSRVAEIRSAREASNPRFLGRGFRVEGMSEVREILWRN